LISAGPVFSLSENNSADLRPLIEVVSHNHYAPLIVGLGVTAVIFNRIVYRHGGKILRSLVYFYQDDPNISNSLLGMTLLKAPIIYNYLTLENGNYFFLFLWEKRKALKTQRSEFEILELMVGGGILFWVAFYK
jgi:hypothetical protein